MQTNYLSIDIGGTYIKYAHIDRAGNIESVDKKKTPNNLEALLEVLTEICEPVKNLVRGVGISCPGRVDVTNGVVYNGGALPFLHGFSFRDFFNDNFDLECAVINDGKAAALSEVWLGNLKGIANGAAIVLGTGVGGGIIVNGELAQGSHFQAGELSFLLRSPGAANLENIIGFTGSAVTFVKAAAQQLKLQDESDGIAVFEAINSKQNLEVTRLFEQYCREIAFIILNLQAILDIEKVVIGGGVSTQETLIKEINNQYIWIRESSELFSTSFDPVTIAPCSFRNNSNLLGAIYQFLLQAEEKQLEYSAVVSSMN